MLAESYDQVEGFARYWDEEAWRSEYFGGKFKPFYLACREVTSIYRLLARAHQMPMIDALEDPLLKVALLGGLQPDGTIGKYGMARFCRELFGFKPEDWTGYVHLLKEGLSFEQAAEEFVCVTEETDFTKMLGEIHDLASSIVMKARGLGLIGATEEGKLNVEELRANPELLAEKVREFLQKALELLANYNPYTFFLYTLWRVTGRFMNAAYLRTADPEVLRKLKEVFGLTEIFVPEASPSIAKEYTIYGFEPGSLGHAIVELNKKIWDLTSLKAIQEFFGLENERVKFAKRAARELKLQLGASVEFPSGKVSDWEGGLWSSFPEFPEFGYRPYEWYSLSRLSLGRTGYSLTEFLDAIAPYLFLHFCTVEPYRRDFSSGIKCKILPFEQVV